jgi:hypothetical protein
MVKKDLSMSGDIKDPQPTVNGFAKIVDDCDQVS